MNSNIVNEADVGPFAIGNKFAHHINIQWPNGYGRKGGKVQYFEKSPTSKMATSYKTGRISSMS